MHWIYQTSPISEPPEGAVGFVYIITNNLTGKKYIGKKFLWSKRRKKVAGRVNRKVVITESNWKDYYGSSDILNEDIKKLGQKNFSKEILAFYPTKREVSYGEIEEQIVRKVLTARLPDGTREYYNNNILGKWYSPETKKKIYDDVKKKVKK